MQYLWLLIGFIIIIKSSDVLVDASSNIANHFKVPKVLIALSIVAFGTCAPELAISFNSIVDGNGSVALANVIGSCIINIVLIIGIASVVHPIKLKNNTIKKELPVLIFITIIFVALMSNRLLFVEFGALLRIDGVILLLSFLIFIIYLVGLVKKEKEQDIEVSSKYGMSKNIVYIIISLILIIISSELIVNNAVLIAQRFGISHKVITMVVIVIGTSLPELVTTITAAKKNEFEIAIGNIIGTNIFNICIVLGLPVAIFGNVNIIDFNIIDILIVLLSSLMLYLFSKSENKLSRIEGIIMVAVFIIYYAYVLFF